jgi:hypothetical protein
MSGQPELDATTSDRHACQYCGGRIGKTMPLWLVATQLGELIGPYHGSCANKVKIAFKGSRTRRAMPGESFGRLAPVMRQEELPW